jgi:hypothetical protein
MPIHLILDKQITGRCRICEHPFFDTDSDRFIGAHNATCGQKHYEQTKQARDRLRFLEPADPEFTDYVKTAYENGSLKPSTKRVS